MDYLKNHLISSSTTIKETLTILDKQALIANVLFVVDDKNKLCGSVSDGDVRRGLLNDVKLTGSVETVMNRNCKFLKQNFTDNKLLSEYRKLNIFFLPLVNDELQVLSIINLKEIKTILPVDAVIMAGGKGVRLLPLTLTTPKPLLRVGNKPIIEHNIDRIKSFGIQNIHISVNYLGEQLVEYFGDGSSKNLSIKFISENKPLGTVGAIKLAEDSLSNEVILIMNSDLLTTIDLDEFYNEFIHVEADMAVAATSYNVDIPYAVLEVKQNNIIQSLKEKPRYTYYSNAGIYLIKKSVLQYIPHNNFFNSTDLIEKLIEAGKKVITFPILGYWLDIGNTDDYKKAQEDVAHLNL